MSAETPRMEFRRNARGHSLRPWAPRTVPRLLVESTTRAATCFLSGSLNTEFVSSSVQNVARGVLNIMLIHQLKTVAIGLLGVACLGLGVMALARQVPGARQGVSQTGPVSDRTKEPARPRVLDLVGATSSVPEKTVSIHVPFDCSVDKILVDLGSSVRPGDPLLELSSTVLAEAKSNFEIATSQWNRDRKVLDYKSPLARANNISHKEIIEAENDEAQSRLKMKLARDKLLVYGLTENEIGNAKNEDGAEKARMILRSPASGTVIRRNAVQGNYYSSADTLLVIASLDTLLVIAGVDAPDAEKLAIGQRLTVKFGFTDQITNARVEAISWDAVGENGKALIRTSIPNPGHRLRANMLVRLGVELVPEVASKGVTEAVVPETSSLSLERRLNEMERKLERLLDEKRGRSANEEILRRLSELEGKLDRVLKPPAGQ